MSEQKTGCSLKIDGIAFVLSVVFMVLKLCHVIEWSWVWVFSPLWISLVLTLIAIIIWAIAVHSIYRFK